MRRKNRLCRSLFACGTVQAAANALGGNAAQQVAAWRASHARLWKSVADSCRAVPAGILTAALEAFNQDKAARGRLLDKENQPRRLLVTQLPTRFALRSGWVKAFVKDTLPEGQRLSVAVSQRTTSHIGSEKDIAFHPSQPKGHYHGWQGVLWAMCTKSLRS